MFFCHGHRTIDAVRMGLVARPSRQSVRVLALKTAPNVQSSSTPLSLIATNNARPLGIDADDVSQQNIDVGRFKTPPRKIAVRPRRIPVERVPGDFF